MSQLPDGIALKVRNAEERVKQLAARHDEYVNGGPMSFQPEFWPAADETQGAWGLRARVDTNVPGDLSIIAGEAVQGLRHSLDHLAYALVLANGGTPQIGTGGTVFPILEKPPRQRLTVRGGIASQAMEVVEKLQPYKASDPAKTPLSILNTLANVDKHRSLLSGLAAVTAPAAYALFNNTPSEPYGLIQPSMLVHHHGDFTVGPFFPASQDADVVAEVEGAICLVAFADIETFVPLAMDEVLDHLLRVVRDEVIPQFEPFFDGVWPGDLFAFQPPASPYEELKSRLRDATLPSRLVGRILARHPTQDGSEPRVIILDLVEGLSADLRFDNRFLRGVYPEHF